MTAQRYLYRKMKENVFTAFREYELAHKTLMAILPVMNRKMKNCFDLLDECKEEKNRIVKTAIKQRETSQLVKYLMKNCEDIRHLKQDNHPVSKLITDVEIRLCDLNTKLKSGENVIVELYNSLYTSKMSIEKFGMQHITVFKVFESHYKESKIVLMDSISFVERILFEMKTPNDFPGVRIYSDEDICLAVFNSKWGYSKWKLPSGCFQRNYDLYSTGADVCIGNKRLLTDGKKIIIGTVSKNLKRKLYDKFRP